jgi:hypothetical protein
LRKECTFQKLALKLDFNKVDVIKENHANYFTGENSDFFYSLMKK